MKNQKICPSSLLLACLLVLALTATPVHAQQGQGFSDSFDDPQLPGWEHTPEVVVTAGILQIGPGQFAARMGGWEDFDLTLKVRFRGEGETHINYRATDQGAYILHLMTGEAVLFKRGQPGQEEELGRASAPEIQTDTWLVIQISLSGGEHTITLNGQALLTVTDPEPAGPGTVVLASLGQRTTEVDEITLAVTAASASAPAGPVEPVAAATTAPAAQAPAPTSWQDFLRSLSASQGSPFEMDVFIVNLILAVITSFILSRVYIYWGGSLSNRRKFAANFILVTVTTTFIILVVRSSVALSLGLVGALSIIRFRAAIKDPEELAYLFFAISLGIGLGDNQRAVTLVTLAIVILVIGLARLLRQTQADVNLHLEITSQAPEKVTVDQVMEALAKHVEKLRLLRYDETAEAVEMSFVVEFRHIANLNQAQTALKAISPGLQISFLDNRGVW